MSQQELERGDQEVMDVVNGHSHPNAQAAAEKIQSQQQKKGTIGAVERAMIAQWQEEREQTVQNRRILWTIVQVLSCVLVAALFVAALMDPGFVVHLVNVGVLACGITAALIVDRWLRGQ